MKSFLHSRAPGCSVGVAIPMHEQHHWLLPLWMSPIFPPTESPCLSPCCSQKREEKKKSIVCLSFALIILQSGYFQCAAASKVTCRDVRLGCTCLGKWISIVPKMSIRSSNSEAGLHLLQAHWTYMFGVRYERGFLISGGLFIVRSWIDNIFPHKEKKRSQYNNVLLLHYNHLFCYLDLEILIKASVSTISFSS